MAIKLNADEAWTVYCALDDMSRNRRNGVGSKHSYKLTEEEHLNLMGRYLRSALVLDASMDEQIAVKNYRTTLAELTGGKDE